MTLLQQLNYFSLLIPLFLLALLLAILILARYRKLSNYMAWFTAAIFFAVVLQVLQTILVPDDLYQWAAVACLLFFISIICTTHAVYLRLHIKTNWLRIFGIIVLSELCIAYFSLVQQSIEARVSLVALTSILICVHRPHAFIQSKPVYFLERLLKLSFYAMIFSILVRAIYLIIYFHSDQLWLQNQQFIWAMSQFLVLFFTVLLITIFISCSITDTMRRLNKERNLDPLTNTLNRRALHEQLTKFHDVELTDQHIILLCDIDYFKKINDQYGHDVGDMALKHISKILSKFSRTHDTLARIGGEEFQLILYDLPQQIAINRAKQICLYIAEHPLQYKDLSIQMTISIGISSFNHVDNYQAALQQADLLLYQAKKMGRNNVQWKLKD